MTFTPPLGFDRVEPLRKSYRVVLPEPRAVPPRLRGQHLIPLARSEFAAAGRDYPVVFVSRSGGGMTSAIVTGLATGQNLFVMPDGTWDRRTYLPAYVVRYPFLVANVATRGTPEGEKAVCVECDAVSDDGTRLHDEDGLALPVWSERERFLLEFEAQMDRAQELCDRLVELDVLEPFSTRLTVGDFTLSLNGLRRVSRERLAALPARTLERLIRTGDMDCIYAHLMSMGSFERMSGRRNFIEARESEAVQLAS